ncbi:MAG TPA: hypothetical protein QF730_10915 [Planctomycetota bacterium]|nr:hypothetical protein [Planctomycetota bacterium]
MTSTLFQDPDLAEVLLDVVNDQNSTLFRVPLSTVADGMAGACVSISARSAGLTSAERHLLDVHRTELAEHLRLAAWKVLERKPETRDRLVLDWEIPDDETWASAARAELATEGVSSPGSEVDLLRSCVEAGLDNYTSAIPLAMAAQRLVDTCSTREVIALDTLFHGHHASAERMLREILRTPRTDREVYYALLNLGGVASQKGCFAIAATRYLEAATLRPQAEEAFAAAFTNAVLAGSEEIALIAGNRLDADGTLPAVSRQFSDRTTGDGDAAQLERTQTISRNIVSRVNAQAKELIHALVQE